MQLTTSQQMFIQARSCFQQIQPKTRSAVEDKSNLTTSHHNQGANDIGNDTIF